MLRTPTRPTGLQLKTPPGFKLRELGNRFLDRVAAPWMSRLTDEEYFSVQTRRAGLKRLLTRRKPSA